MSFRRAVRSRLHLTPPPPPPPPLARAVTASPLAFSRLVARRTSRTHRTSRSIAARASRRSRAASTRTNLSRRPEDLVSTTSPTRVRSRACARARVRARARARDSSNPRAASPRRSIVSRCRNARRDGTKNAQFVGSSFVGRRSSVVVRSYRLERAQDVSQGVSRGVVARFPVRLRPSTRSRRPRARGRRLERLRVALAPVRLARVHRPRRRRGRARDRTRRRRTRRRRTRRRRSPTVSRASPTRRLARRIESNRTEPTRDGPPPLVHRS